MHGFPMLVQISAGGSEHLYVHYNPFNDPLVQYLALTFEIHTEVYLWRLQWPTWKYLQVQLKQLHRIENSWEA